MPASRNRCEQRPVRGPAEHSVREPVIILSVYFRLSGKRQCCVGGCVFTYACTTSCPTARVRYYHFGLLVLGNNHVCRCQPEGDKTLRKRRLHLARRILTRHANIDSQIPVPSAEGWLHARRLCRWPITGFIGSSITGCVAEGQISSTMSLGGLWQRVRRSFAVCSSIRHRASSRRSLDRIDPQGNNLDV